MLFCLYASLFLGVVVLFSVFFFSFSSVVLLLCLAGYLYLLYIFFVWDLVFLFSFLFFFSFLVVVCWGFFLCSCVLWFSFFFVVCCCVVSVCFSRSIVNVFFVFLFFGLRFFLVLWVDGLFWALVICKPLYVGVLFLFLRLRF